MDKQNRVEALKALHDIELNGPYVENYNEFQKNLFELMRELNEDEIAELARYALDSYDSQAESPNLSEELLLRLVCIHPDKFPPSVYIKMLELGIDYPYDFYHNANRELSLAVAEKLAGKTSKKHPLMEIFVRGTDDYVTQQIQNWEANPPEWWPKTFNYPLEAGWELTPEGKRRYLYHETCYQLVPSTGEKPKMQREDTCQWCDQKLVNFLDLDLTDSRLSFLKLDGTRLVIAFCSWCHAFQEQYFELDFEGNAKWSHYNRPEPPFRLDYDEGEMPNILVLAEKPRGRFESLVMGYGQSQIGGFPAWVNNAAYPICPSCKKHMQFIGQVQWWDVDKGHVEGNSYALLCPDCKISLVNYDQT